mgnify:CR=1 FL=1
MKITGPEIFELKINNPKEFKLLPKSEILYSKKRISKLYIISYKNIPIYVGITKQPIRNRLNFGFKAEGKGGYHGYLWRRHREYKKVGVSIWFDKSDSHQINMETIEAEIVYAIRKRGQWPKDQTEIHFHQSGAEHRKWAKEKLKSFKFK